MNKKAVLDVLSLTIIILLIVLIIWLIKMLTAGGV